jgi:Predicted nucleotide-binding protein containing TIR-like domain
MIRLEPEQQSLFAQLVQARAGVAREKREEFMLVRTFGGDLLRGNGLEIQVLHEDVIALDDAGLIRVTNRHRDGTGFNFVVPASALDYYDRITSGSAEPDEGPLTAASVSGTESSGAQADLPAKDVDPRAVMVVHGRNDAARRAMFDFLRALKLNPLEWGTLVAGTKKGAPYVGEVLDHAFHAAAAVVVLFTPDDEVRLRETLRDPGDPSYEAELTPQARPNVLFEAGMALGLHPNRTILVELGQLVRLATYMGVTSSGLARARSLCVTWRVVLSKPAATWIRAVTTGLIPGLLRRQRPASPPIPARRPRLMQRQLGRWSISTRTHAAGSQIETESCTPPQRN